MTDAQGCTLDSTLEVVIPDTLEFETLVTQEDVGNDASIALDIFGGTPPTRSCGTTEPSETPH